MVDLQVKVIMTLGCSIEKSTPWSKGVISPVRGREERGRELLFGYSSVVQCSSVILVPTTS